ncbi:hypothetical protein SAMN05192574_106350 [Mucilaginibacter gossypiicola]|uniref:Uncharacterized protein n=1 Tax=Mucilaginibacter gossypiicola TaxID=551995 RepID=A0A1H8NBT0_9SPHI|nr:hypothetical protein SAMN05192574_106350 [Mucilaginibacter gossypiicola]
MASLIFKGLPIGKRYAICLHIMLTHFMMQVALADYFGANRLLTYCPVAILNNIAI